MSESMFPPHEIFDFEGTPGVFFVSFSEVPT
jgi:hypothetical protein